MMSAIVTSRKGWRVVAGMAIVLGVIFGATFSSAAVFTGSITEAFGCSYEEADRGVAVFLITMTLVTPLVGWLIGRVGPRRVMTSGALLAVLGYVLAARSGSISELVVAMGLAGIGVGASTYVPAFTLATFWIAPRDRGLAFGILVAGASAGSIFFPILLTNVITELGWRSGMTVIAVSIAVICVPILIWLAKFPEKNAQQMYEPSQRDRDGAVGKALRAPRYWAWITVVTLITLSSLCIYVAFVPYLISVGYSASNAAKFYAVTNAFTLAGNLAFGMITNRFGARKVLVWGSIFSAVGILLLLAAHNAVYGWSAVAFFAFAWGSSSNLINQLSPMLLVETMGESNFGSLFGVGNLISGIGTALSPEIVGYLVDMTHAYDVALLLSAALLVISLPQIAWLRPVGTKRRDMDAEISSVI